MSAQHLWTSAQGSDEGFQKSRKGDSISTVGVSPLAVCIRISGTAEWFLVHGLSQRCYVPCGQLVLEGPVAKTGK